MDTILRLALAHGGYVPPSPGPGPDPGPGPGPIPPTDPSLIRANFCGHLDHRGRIVFDPNYFVSPQVTADDRRQCYAIKRSLGLNAIVVQIPEGRAYPGYWGSPNPDWTHDLGRFTALVDEILAAGFTPIIFLTSGDNLDVLGLYSGELRRKARALAPYARRAWIGAGWEMTGSQHPTITTKQTNDSLRVMHEELGDGAWLFVHGADWERCTAASYPVESDDPSGGDEIGWWYTPEALWCRAWFWQSRHGGDGPSYNDDAALKAWRGRAIECQIRFLAPGDRPAPMAATEPRAPDWMASRSSNRPIFCVFELEPYEYIHGQCSDARVAHVSALMHADGFLHLGSGT